MENINIEKKDDSPKVIMDFQNALVEFEGECYPENAFDFFEPIIQWFSDYFEAKGNEKLVVNFKLAYFNSATTQVLFDIFDILDENNHQNLTINWYYDEENNATLKDYEEFSEEFEDLNIQAIKL